MKTPLKKAAIFFAMVSCVLFATGAMGADDWTVDFDIGIDVSAYNTGKTEYDGFSDLNFSLGAVARQPLSERLSIFEGVHLRPLNIEQGSTVARDMDTVDIELGLEYILTPWPPPPLRWLPSRLPKWTPSLPTLKNNTEVYFKASGNFLFPEDSSVDQDNFNTTFFGIGWRYNNASSKMNGSYVELGTGGSERFDSSWRYLKNNIKFFYKVSDDAEGWKAYISSEIDVGSGDDDFRFGVGLCRDAKFIANLLKGLSGNK
jgi:hypothetical protein